MCVCEKLIHNFCLSFILSLSPIVFVDPSSPSMGTVLNHILRRNYRVLFHSVVKLKKKEGGDTLTVLSAFWFSVHVHHIMVVLIITKPPLIVTKEKHRAGKFVPINGGCSISISMLLLFFPY